MKLFVPTYVDLPGYELQYLWYPDAEAGGLGEEAGEAARRGRDQRHARGSQFVSHARQGLHTQG